MLKVYMYVYVFACNFLVCICMYDKYQNRHTSINAFSFTMLAFLGINLACVGHVYMYVNMYVCMYIRMYICVYVIGLCMFECMYIGLHLGMYASHIHASVYVSICMYVY